MLYQLGRLADTVENHAQYAWEELATGQAMFPQICPLKKSGNGEKDE
jgi:hypothetical protein